MARTRGDRKPLSRLACLGRGIATHPIEIIVLTFIFVTLAYFQLLQAVKESDFLNAVGSGPLSSSQQVHSQVLAVNSLARAASGDWKPIEPTETAPAGSQHLFIKQIAISHDSPRRASNQLNSVVAFDRHLRQAPTAEHTSFEDDLCFKTPKGQCFAASALSDAHQADTTTLLYALKHNELAWPPADALPWTDEAAEVTFSSTRHRNRTPLHIQSASSDKRSATSPAASASSGILRDAGLGISLPLSPKQGSTLASDELASWEYHASRSSIREMAGLKWAFYAVRSFMLRFWSLAKKADSADIAVMLVAYFLMHLTFVSLYLNMRKLGSRFWLASSVLVSSVFGFICSLFAAYMLNLTVNPVTLSEALPFMVVVIGFDKPFVLARAVFSHPAAITRPVRPASEDRRMLSSLSFITEEATVLANTRESKPVQDIVAEAVQSTGARIVRDYAIEIVVLLVGALSGVHGLTEFCQLGALILAVDCASLFTLYVAFLTVILEVRRIRNMRTIGSKVSSSDLANILDDNSTPAGPTENLSLWNTFGQLFKDSLPGRTTTSGPTSSVKLLLVAVFVGLHVLNLITPLSSHFKIHAPLSSSNGAQAMSPALTTMLQELSSMFPKDVSLVAHLHTAQAVQAAPVGIPTEGMDFASDYFTSSPLGLLDWVFTAWGHLTGDPVMSKWISLALGISVFLNGYLLKGIALGSSRVEAAEAAARILLTATGQLTADDTKPGKILRRHSLGAESMPVIRPKYSRQFQENTSIPEEPRSRTSSQSSASGKPELASMSPIEPLSAQRTTLSSDNNTVIDGSSSATTLKPTIALSSASSTTASANFSDNGASTPATTAIDSEDGVILPSKPRPFDECANLFDAGQALLLSDEEIIMLVQKGKVAAYSLEKLLKDHQRAVRIRRALISRASLTKTLESSVLPYMHYDYSKVMGQCCENVVGYTPIPIGIAGPLRIDGISLPIPMATTEGALIASTSRGCKALNAGGGVTTVLHHDAMTRGPALEFSSLKDAASAKLWIESGEGEAIMKSTFNSTSRFARLQKLKCALAGRTLFVRFATQTGDAMGMNMISKGTEKALETMMQYFPGMRIVSLSANYCTDKKPAAINWIEGRGKSVVAEAVIPGAIVKSILKTTVTDLNKLNVTKNLIGSAMAGSVGGFNAHASNILTAIYLATGQDPAQNVESSQCMTLLEPTNDGEDLLMTCSMPSIEVGTIGGGTILGPQKAMLEMLGVAGPHPEHPGQNAQTLARIICASVMAGELSLMSALASGHLVKSHLALNRSAPATPATMKFTGHAGFTPAPTRPATPGPTHLRNGFAFSSAD